MMAVLSRMMLTEHLQTARGGGQEVRHQIADGMLVALTEYIRLDGVQLVLDPSDRDHFEQCVDEDRWVSRFGIEATPEDRQVQFMPLGGMKVDQIVAGLDGLVETSEVVPPRVSSLLRRAIIDDRKIRVHFSDSALKHLKWFTRLCRIGVIEASDLIMIDLESITRMGKWNAETGRRVTFGTYGFRQGWHSANGDVFTELVCFLTNYCDEVRLTS